MAVKAHPKPCVNISGGIDSTIILHHLTEQTVDTIYTYTVGFNGAKQEFETARKVADHYGTKHKEIKIKNMLPTFKKILQYFDRARWNLWPWWLAEQAHKDGRLNCYIGEGGDEHFGGYWYKPRKTYVENWAGFFTYVYPTYKTIYDHWGIQLVAPLHPANINCSDTIQYYDSVDCEKMWLRRSYRGILPDFVIDNRKHPGRFSYWDMWNREMQPYFPDADPQSEDEIRQLLNVWVHHEWSQVHDGAVMVETEKDIHVHI